MTKRSTLASLSDDERRAFFGRFRSTALELGKQADAAKALGVSLSQFKNYLSGSSAPPINVLQRLSEGRKVSLDWLINGTGLPRQLPEQMLSQPGNQSEDAVLLRVLALLSEIYGPTEAPIDPLLDRDIFFLSDAKEDVMMLPPEHWEVGFRLVSNSHRAALSRLGKSKGH